MKNWKTWMGVALVALATTPAFAQKANSIVVDGSDWMSATPVERRAFLVGAANLIVAEEAYAKRRSTPPAPVSSQLAKAADKLTIAEIEARITRWYEANPTRMATPALGVAWRTIVKGQP
jgi:hypothetical protein